MDPGFALGCVGPQSSHNTSLQILLRAHSLPCVGFYFCSDLRGSLARLHLGLGSEDAPLSKGTWIRISLRTEISTHFCVRPHSQKAAAEERSSAYELRSVQAPLPPSLKPQLLALADLGGICSRGGAAGSCPCFTGHALGKGESSEDYIMPRIAPFYRSAEVFVPRNHSSFPHLQKPQKPASLPTPTVRG